MFFVAHFYLNGMILRNFLIGTCYFFKWCFLKNSEQSGLMFIQKLNGFCKRYLPFANGYRKYLLISYNEIFQMKSNDFSPKHSNASSTISKYVLSISTRIKLVGSKIIPKLVEATSSINRCIFSIV